MKKVIGNIRYGCERAYPYILASIVTKFLIVNKIYLYNSKDFSEVLNGLVTLDSIIIGFLGAIMPVILSMKNESKFVRYVFEKDQKNLFMKYLKVTIFWGLFDAVLSLIMHTRDLMVKPENMYFLWMFVTVVFISATYRSMSYMVVLLFAKDEHGSDAKDEIVHGLSIERNEELKRKYGEGPSPGGSFHPPKQTKERQPNRPPHPPK